MLGDVRRLRLAHSLVLSLPGTPVLRYGDEIGMGDDLSLKERDSVRTPMQWSDEPNAGFSSAEKTILPVIDQGAFGYEYVNAAAQRRDPNSMLNWTERIIRMRKEVPEVGWGDFAVLNTGTPAVLAIRYDWRMNSVLFVHNLDSKPREVSFSAGVDDDRGKLLVNLLTNDHSRANERGRHQLLLQAYDYRWYRVGGLDYLLNRSEIDEKRDE
jgi:maltose alpha-D-glucosyltransferase/alpha-amylase